MKVGENRFAGLRGARDHTDHVLLKESPENWVDVGASANRRDIGCNEDTLQ